MTTKSIFNLTIAILASLSLVGCTTHVYNYNPVDPSKKIEYTKEEFHEDRILRQDGKVLTYDEAIKFLSEQEYSKETMKTSDRKNFWGGSLALTGNSFILAGLIFGATIGQYLVSLLGIFIGTATTKSGRNDVLKAVDQHNIHIEQSKTQPNKQ